MGGYGNQLRYDFHHYLHQDIDDWLRGERDWRSFAELAHELPQGSRFKAAQRHDREIAEAMWDALDGQRPPPPPDPTFDDYDKTVEKLTDLVDVVSAIAAGMSGGKATPQKRPKTAFEIVKREQASIGLSSALSQLLPGQ